MFKQSEDQIILDNGVTHFLCTETEFTDSTVEPDYVGLPDGIVCITYDPGGEGVHQSDGSNQMALDSSIDQDTLSGYVTNMATIVAAVTSLRTQLNDIFLSDDSVDEGLSIGSVVGYLEGEAVESDFPYIYTLVSGEGDTGNSSFQISESELQTNSVFDYNAQNSYSIRVRVTNNSTQTFEKVFTITINEVA